MTDEVSTNGAGISGRLARRFVSNPMTPLLALVGLLLGMVAMITRARKSRRST
jgi:hypothetical protein